MSGKKLGLEGKYKDLYKNKNTLSINPMQDDLNKSMGMGSVSSYLTRRAILSGANVSKLSRAGKSSSVKDTVKKVLTSKPSIASGSAAAGYEIGKSEGKKYGGSMKKMLSGGQAKIDANKDGKITGEDFKMLQAKKKGMKVKKANLGLLMANKKIAGAGLLGLGMLAGKRGMFNKGGESKIKKVMGEFKKGELNIGKSKKKVKNRKQAIAIALSEARKKQKNGKRKA